jgi:hypothetical protein
MNRAESQTKRFASRSSTSRPVPRPSSLGLLIRWFVRLRLLWIILIAFLLLSGCVRYEVGVNFADTNHGTITQQVHLSTQITGVSRATANIWLNSLAKQAEELGGDAKQLTSRDLLLTIPFYNGKDFVTKFDSFFQTLTSLQQGERRSRQPALSQLQLKTNNFIFWQRNHLIYDLDLRSLSIIPDANNVTTLLVDPADFLGLKFTLNTPWGAYSPVDSSASDSNSALPAIQRHGKQLIWALKPGEVNHLEAVFSVPSPIGIGLGVIVLLVGGGILLRAWRNPSSLIDLASNLPTASLGERSTELPSNLPTKGQSVEGQ